MTSMNSPSLRKCIYCLEEKPAEEFNREHVINEAFGTYDEDTMTLDCVCRDCNQALGDSIDLCLARGTYEGLHRLRLSVRKPEEKVIADAKARLDEVLLVMPGPLDGILLDIILSADGTMKVVPIPQVGFRRTDNGQWINLPLKRFLEGGKPDLPKCDKIRSLCNSDEQTEQFKSKVAEYELPLTGAPESLPAPGDDVWVDVRWHITEAVRRSIAKIAFNYAAHNQGAAFVLKAHFDPVRRFIRYGEGDCLDFVRVSPDRVTAEGSLQSCHFVALEMKDTRDVIVSVSIFNSFIYSVRLARTYPIWFRLACGHCFDPVDKRVYEIAATRLHIPGWTEKQRKPPPLIRRL